MNKQYIQAVLEMIAEGKSPDAIIDGLVKTLEAKGHMRLYASVLRGVLRILETETNSNVAIVTVVDEKAAVKYADAIKQSLSTLSADSKPETKVDPTIIGGYTVEFNDVLIDKSHKAQLVSLYRKLT